MSPAPFREPDWDKPPQQWEDGLRVEPGPTTFEWWYVDAQMEDGSTVVILFEVRSLQQPGAQPGVLLTITTPDHRELNANVPPGELSASKERCDVKIGPNWLRGDLHCYELHVEGDGLGADLKIVGQVSAWRPKPAAGDQIAAQLGWIAAVPYGKVTGTLTYDGKGHQVSGSAYHDHDFGSVEVLANISHWFWGRGHLGDYTTIYSEVYGAGTLAGQVSKVFFLARGDTILAEEGLWLTLTPRADAELPPNNHIYPDGLHCTWQTLTRSIELAINNPRIIGEIEPPPSQYARFQAVPVLTLVQGDKTDTVKGSTLYELMRLRPG